MSSSVCRWLSSVVLVAQAVAWVSAPAFGAPEVNDDAIVVDVARDEALPTLVVMLDAMPLSVVQAAYRDGLMTNLGEPLPLISTFPSTTTVALSGAFAPIGMAQPPGYEARFFDWERSKIRGGGLISYKLIETKWPQFFDWRIESALRKGVGFVRPLRFSGVEIERGVESFLRSDKKLFLMYVSATDGAAHLKGPESLRTALEQLARALEGAEAVKDFHTVIFSDHGIAGGQPLINVRPDVRRSLRKAGYRVRSRLKNRRDVALVPYGLLTSLVAYADDDERETVARTLARVEGVSLCATPRVEAGQDGVESWVVASHEGEARIDRRGPSPDSHEQELRYSTLDADPLGYDRHAGRWLGSDAWLERTGDEHYPDALHRVTGAFELVDNPASVVCSVAPGHMFGPWLTEWSGRLTVGRLRYTHGARDKQESMGFVMSDHPSLEPAAVLRVDEVLADLLEE